MSKRTIYLPAIERHVSLGQYVAAVKMAKANPDAEFRHGFTCWWPCKGAQVMLQFRDGMMDRISQGIPYTKRK